MKMMDTLRMFLKGERMDIWALHIQTMYETMPYLAVYGHNLYTKCIQVYLQQMNKLHETHPYVCIHFGQGLHVVRISDRSWAGLSPDLVIEQLLMRSMKTSVGLTRGRCMTETQLTGVQYNISEQHKYLTKARQGKYMTCELLEFLES